MEYSLARSLWSGPLSAPQAPAQDLAARIARGLDYPEALAALQGLARHGLPLNPALRDALSQWDWSIDLAQVALQAAVSARVDPAPALAELQRRVEAQGRRFGVLAWAFWGLGRCDQARAVLADLDPKSDSYDPDRLARAELAILSGEAPEPLALPGALRLSLLHLWRDRGARALTQRYQTLHFGFSAHPPLWAWLIDAFITERDFTHARHAVERLRAAHPEGHAEVVAQRIRLAIEQNDPVTARRLLTKHLPADTPWTWSERQHLQHLRCLLLEAAQAPILDYAAAYQHAFAAQRLYPENAALGGLWLTLREICEDWDGLAAELMSDNRFAPDRASILARIGRPDAALRLTETPPPLPPDTALRLRLSRAQWHLRCGALAAATAELDPLPQDWPLRADHVYWAAEIALAKRDTEAARRALSPALSRHPTRLGLILSAARMEYFAGDFAAAQDHLQRFQQLKAIELGTPPKDDLRDMIVRDAAEAQTEKRATANSPGLAARHFALSPAAFLTPPEPAEIPRQLWHYWEGPRSSGVSRGIETWAQLHQGFIQRVFDAQSAAAWLEQHAPDLAPVFARLSQPALRADLFRIALIAQEGGVFADLDEFPRAPVMPWLADARAVMVIEEGHGTIANNFLAALPALPLFTRLSARIAHRLTKTQTPYAWWDSGPAQLTLEVFAAQQSETERAGLRFLTQAAYEQRISTNLPFVHKRSSDHWR
ncbi:glycosyltransferase [Pararhodobacter oceanensis]|uniref:glycosyltransferase n=1 Tax=Pararhodobacter oceanensis TaxID=2172121 RepID=UPI003A91F2D4